MCCSISCIDKRAGVVKRKENDTNTIIRVTRGEAIHTRLGVAKDPLKGGEVSWMRQQINFFFFLFRMHRIPETMTRPPPTYPELGSGTVKRKTLAAELSWQI